jgi:hypothetical protein
MKRPALDYALAATLMLAMAIPACKTIGIPDIDVPDITDIPDVVIPDITTTTQPPDANEIRMDPTVKYTDGCPSNNKNEVDAPPRNAEGKRDEIWQHNWHAMNVRLYNNGGHVRDDAKVPQGSRWYPLRRSAMPNGAVVLTKTDTGCTAAARDFISTSGQKYRFEGWFSDGKGKKLHRVYTLTMTNKEMKGALIGNWSSCE